MSVAKTKAYTLDIEDPDIMNLINQDVPRLSEEVCTSLNFSVIPYSLRITGKTSKEYILAAANELVVRQYMECLAQHIKILYRKGLKVADAETEVEVRGTNNHIWFVTNVPESDIAYEARRARVIKRRITIAKSKRKTPEEKRKEKEEKKKEADLNIIRKLAEKHGLKDLQWK